MNYDISIIIPVYNTEKYLRECLDSVIAQTKENIEIICVNDGSKDNSLKILNEYAQMDSRIKVIDKPNGGVATARKAGLAASSGEYIGFIDSDDWIEPDMYEQLYTVMRQNNADMVTSGYFKDGNFTLSYFDNLEKGLYSNEKMVGLRKKFMYDLKHKRNTFCGFLVNKLFKKSLISKIQNQIPGSIVRSEDRVIVSIAVLEAKRVYVTHGLFYHYRINPCSITNFKRPDELLNIHEIYKYMSSLYVPYNFTKEMITQVELYVIERFFDRIDQYFGYTNRNLFLVDPYCIEKIPAGSKMVIYGVGGMGKIYYNLLLSAGFDIAACVLYEYDHLTNDPLNPQSPDILNDIDFDYVLIAFRDMQTAKAIKERLISDGIESSKILWFGERLFWKFAEANGLL